MIIRQRTGWLNMIFIWKGSVLKNIMPQMISIFIFSILILIFKGKIYDYKIHLNPAIFTLLGLALAIFMGFVNTASYDRYWEGRKLWGSLLIEARSFTRQVFTLIAGDTESDRENRLALVKMISAFSWSLNYQLRHRSDYGKLRNLLTEAQFAQLERRSYKPVAILDFMGDWLAERYREGKIDSILLSQMDDQVNHFSQILGGCERIANTPLPFPYSILLHRSVYIYCFLLPFGLVDVVGFMMPVIVMFVAYTFIALDALIQEIEEPFGERENDLPLNMICGNIENSIFEQAGLPVEKKAVNASYFRD